MWSCGGKVWTTWDVFEALSSKLLFLFAIEGIYWFKIRHSCELLNFIFIKCCLPWLVLIPVFWILFVEIGWILGIPLIKTGFSDWDTDTLFSFMLLLAYCNFCMFGLIKCEWIGCWGIKAVFISFVALPCTFSLYYLSEKLKKWVAS